MIERSTRPASIDQASDHWHSPIINPSLVTCFPWLLPRLLPQAITSIPSMPAENAVPIELLQFKLTSEELQLLLQHKEEWQGADRTERRRIAECVYMNLKKNNPDWTEDDRKLKKEVSTIQSRMLRFICIKHVMLRGYIPGSTPMVESKSLLRNLRTSKSGWHGRYLE
jgi:hypothetical protein